MISCRLILVLLAAALAASAPRAADLRIGMSADVTSIDPHFVNITPNNNVAWHIFEALTHVDENVRLVPGLAESWRPVDPTIWEFRLRKGVRFSDGSELTAEDVAFSIDRPATLTTSPGPFTTFTRPIVGKEIVDRHTIRVRTATPYAMVPYDLNSVFIVSRKAAAGASTEDFNTGKSAVGTGPYKLARFARGDRVELVRNDAYSGPKPAWDRVILRVMPNDGARVTALLADDLDAIEYVPTADLKRVRSTPRFRLEQKVSWRTIFFTLDQRREPPAGVTDKGGRPLDRNPFADARVREAMAKAINRQAIVDRIMDGAAVPASNLVAPPVFGHVADFKPEPYDVDGARKLLAAAGFPQGFATVLAAPNNRYLNDDQIAQTVAQLLARIGIEAKVHTMPLAAYFPKARNLEFPVAMLGWGSFSGDLALRSLALSYDADRGLGAWNWGRYSNPKVDKLVVQALATVDERKREGIAQEAMRLAMADRPVILLHHQVATWAMRRDLAYAARTDEYTFAHHFRLQ
jgi:peptide/nickel transport system substrate-binding protein